MTDKLNDTRQLNLFLEIAVPLLMAEMDESQVALAIKDGGRAVAESGDDLQFGGSKTGITAAKLAKGLAAIAITAPGGVTFNGIHWCGNHTECVEAQS